MYIPGNYEPKLNTSNTYVNNIGFFGKRGQNVELFDYMEHDHKANTICSNGTSARNASASKIQEKNSRQQKDIEKCQCAAEI